MSSNTLPARRTLARRLHGYLSLARISNSPTVISNSLAGAALAGVIVPNAAVALVALAMVLFYTAGMFLNDLCDYAHDQRRRPERPLPSGIVTRTEALVTILVLFGAGSALLALVSRAALLSGLVLIATIVLYDVWHKTNPLSPVIMALCRVLVYWTAFVAFAPQITIDLVLWSAALGCYIVGLTAIAKTEDLPGAARFWPVALLAAPIIVALSRGEGAALGLAAVLVGWIIYSVSFIYGARRNVGAAIGLLIAGIALVDALVLGASGAGPGVIIALLAFGLTIGLQRCIKGT